MYIGVFYFLNILHDNPGPVDGGANLLRTLRSLEKGEGSKAIPRDAVFQVGVLKAKDIAARPITSST